MTADTSEIRICLTVCVCLSLFVCMSMWLCLPDCLRISPSVTVSLFVRLSIYMRVCLIVCRLQSSGSVCLCLVMCLFVCLIVCVCVCLSVCHLTIRLREQEIERLYFSECLYTRLLTTLLFFPFPYPIPIFSPYLSNLIFSVKSQFPVVCDDSDVRRLQDNNLSTHLSQSTLQPDVFTSPQIAEPHSLHLPSL